MFNMIKADNYRTFRNLGFYIGIGIMLLTLCLSIYFCMPGSIASANIELEGEPIIPELESAIDRISYDERSDITMSDIRKIILKTGNYQLDRDILGHNMNLYYIFIFVVVIAITSDFSAGAIKNTLSSAISRKKYFISKSVYVLGLCTTILFANTYICYFANMLFNKGKLSSDLWIMTRTTLTQLPVMLTLACLLIAMAFSVKKTSTFNVISIMFGIMFPLIYSTILNLLNIDVKYFKYTFESMLSNFAGNPKSSYMLTCYVICGIVAVVSITLGWLSFKKSEIK